MILIYRLRKNLWFSSFVNKQDFQEDPMAKIVYVDQAWEYLSLALAYLFYFYLSVNVLMDCVLMFSAFLILMKQHLCFALMKFDFYLHINFLVLFELRRQTKDVLLQKIECLFCLMCFLIKPLCFSSVLLSHWIQIFLLMPLFCFIINFLIYLKFLDLDMNLLFLLHRYLCKPF